MTSLVCFDVIAWKGITTKTKRKKNQIKTKEDASWEIEWAEERINIGEDKEYCQHEWEQQVQECIYEFFQ